MGTTNILDMNNRISALEKSVTSVEEAVDDIAERMDVNALVATGIVLTYDTEYVAPADGYMRGVVDVGASNYIILYGKRTNNTWFPLAQTSGAAEGAAIATGVNLFVPKGMSVKYSGSASANTSCAFIPLAST